VEEADQLVDDLLGREVQLALDRGEPDLRDGPRVGVGAQAEHGVDRLFLAGGQPEPEFDGAAGEPGAPLRQGCGSAFYGEQADDAWIAEERVGVGSQRGSGVTAAARDDRRDDLLGEPAGDLVEDRDGELVDRREALVEVALGQAGLVADIADARRRDAAGAEQLEPGVQELPAAGGQPLVAADAGVGARAWCGGAGRLVRRGDAQILI
jgi:hypothetical protein